MPRKSTKSKIVAFKVEEDLAEFLNNLPNKSDFIRKAILSQFGMNCPLCEGSGVVMRGLHDHFKPIITGHNKRACDKCRTNVEIPLSAENIPSGEKKRYEQFFHGGPLYCTKCFTSIDPCTDCEWHVSKDTLLDHFKKVHSHTN
jgi:hypothetical protein